jgi:hypothetical protein
VFEKYLSYAIQKFFSKTIKKNSVLIIFIKDFSIPLLEFVLTLCYHRLPVVEQVL